MLTKTDFLTYKECPKHLWVETNKPELISKKLNLADEFGIKQGYEVEELACKLFPDGIKIEDRIDAVAEERTRRELERKGVIYQATFIFEDFLTRADIIKFNPETLSYDIYEVKSSNDIKEEHYFDTCFQKIVCEKIGLKIGRIYIVHTNKEYKRFGDINIYELFKIEDVSDEIDKIEQAIELEMYDAIKIMEYPSCNTLESCYKPDECICPEICHKDLPDYSIYDIARISKKNKDILRDDFILDIKDIPDDLKLSDKQSLQVEIAKKEDCLIEKDEIRKILGSLEYPLYFLDYETFNPAIPLYDGYIPYQQMPFQYSLHIVDNESDIKHFEFLAKENKDPIPEMMKSMTEQIPNKGGTVIVWNKQFEQGRNKEIGEMYPEYKDYMESVNNRVFDLMEIFSKDLYLDYRFKGSASIKKVLPVLVPELSYKELDIQEGLTASISWYEMIFGEKTEVERNQIYNNLLKYCELDTLAMVKIREVLEKL